MEIITNVIFIYQYFLIIFKDFIYLFRRDNEIETETQAEGEAGSMQGARRGTRSRIPGSRPEPKADTQPLNHPSIPVFSDF